MRRTLPALFTAAVLLLGGGAQAAAPAAHGTPAQTEAQTETRAEPGTQAPVEAPPDLPSRIIGNPDAPVTIIEYASMTCPHCRSFHVDVLPHLRRSHIDTGKARLIFRDFPLDQLALAAAMIARCAPPASSMAVTTRLFEMQPVWTQASDPVAALTEAVESFGMDRQAVDTCLRNEEIGRPILEQAIHGQQTFDIRSTPSFVIDGEVVVGDRKSVV